MIPFLFVCLSACFVLLSFLFCFCLVCIVVVEVGFFVFAIACLLVLLVSVLFLSWGEGSLSFNYPLFIRFWHVRFCFVDIRSFCVAQYLPMLKWHVGKRNSPSRTPSYG